MITSSQEGRKNNEFGKALPETKALVRQELLSLRYGVAADSRYCGSGQAKRRFVSVAAVPSPEALTFSYYVV
eukprot:1179703-Prorocentrum_minimum.AAC.4